MKLHKSRAKSDVPMHIYTPNTYLKSGTNINYIYNKSDLPFYVILIEFYIMSNGLTKRLTLVRVLLQKTIIYDRFI